MKKALTLIMIFCIMISLIACENNSEHDNSIDAIPTNEPTQTQEEPLQNENREEVKHTGVKLKGKIVGASEYSEGFAFACINERTDTVYCITKEGYIVFEIHVEENNSSQYHKIDAKFTNGFALFNNVIYDYTGKAINPKDVGAEKFYDVAFEGKYILASTFAFDGNSPKYKTGVLDFNLQWVIPLSEAFYDAVGKSLSKYSPYNTSYAVDYCAKDYLYTNINDSFVNLKTGKVTTESPTNVLSSKWLPLPYEASYVTYDIAPALTLNEFQNVYRLGNFVNGKASVIQYDKKSDTASFFLINEKGEQLFDAINLEHRDSNVIYDGNDTILVTTGHTPTLVTAKTYSANGEYIAGFSTETLQTTSGISVFTIGDGVILVVLQGNNYNYEYEALYFSKDFTPLF